MSLKMDKDIVKASRARKGLFTMQNLRRATQVVALLAFIYLFLLNIGHVQVVNGVNGPSAVLALISRAPVDTFLRIDPLIGISTMLAARKVISVLLLYGLPIVLLTIIGGRIFCGWICPLGTTLDAVDTVLFRKKRNLHKAADGIAVQDTRLRNTKYYLLGAILVGSLFSAQIAYFFDPIALITRTFAVALAAPIQMALRAFSQLAPVNQHLPVIASNRFLPDIQLYYRMNLVVAAIFIGIVAANHYSRRFWCRNLCPLGALLGLLSKISVIRRTVGDSCGACRRCERECKMGSIPADPKDYLAPECIYCYSCTTSCPKSSTKLVPSFSKTGYKTELSLNRRRVLQAVGLGVVWTAASKTNVSAKLARDSKIKTSSAQLLRPPGALSEDEFLATCIRCGECMKTCPTNGLQPAVMEAGLEGFWSPVLVPKLGECTQNCNLCSQVCSTQAIQPFKVEEKKHIYIGTAVIDRSMCVAWNSEKPCLICDEYCSYHALKWKTVEGVRRPFVDDKICVGCGICESACPIQPQAAIRVFSFGDKRNMSREEQKQFREAGGYNLIETEESSK